MSTTSTITAAYLDHKAPFHDRLIEVGYSVSAAKKQRQLLAELAALGGAPTDPARGSARHRYGGLLP
jgi:hypothetical protein